MQMRCYWAAIVAVSLGSSSAFAQRNLTEIPPADPELERQALQLADGFEINLFAADPLLAKPIQMNFDSRGRLWLATSETYPQIKPGEKSNDKILVLEDTDGDGKADSTTVFADGLLIPTGVVPGDGGAYVANSTELVHFADTDGDGKADRQRVVLSGFGTEDTHHILHTFRWGPGGNLYFNQSIYIHSHIETPHGVRRLNAGGIWKFRPKTWDLEVYARGWINPWGHQFDRFGQSFVTDGAGGEGINYLLPGAAYRTAAGVAKILPGLNPGSPKYCGLEVVGGRHLPEDWQGNLLTNDFRGHRVCRFELSDDGAGFAARQKADLIKSTHVAFRPVDVKMGPDGAIYIADWYNPIIQHGEVDFRDPRRDHTHGRIWRVTYKGKPLVKRPQLAKATMPELLDFLKAPEAWTRHHAKRELSSRDQEEVALALGTWLNALDASHAEFDHHRLEALWAYQTIDVVHEGLLKQLLFEAKAPEVRAAAVRVGRDWVANPQIAEWLTKCTRDENPRVRLEAIRAIGQIKDNSRVIREALAALEFPRDRWIDHALWLTCRETADQWLPLVKSGAYQFEGDAAQLAFALEAVGARDVVSSLVKRLDDKTLTEENRIALLSVVALQGTPNDWKRVLREISNDKLPMASRKQLLSQLVAAAKSSRQRPKGPFPELAKLLEAENQNLHAHAAELIGLWKAQGYRASLIESLQQPDIPESFQSAAMTAIAQLGGAESQTALLQFTNDKQPWKTRVIAVQALSQLDLSASVSASVELLQGMPDGEDPAAVFAAVLGTKEGPGKFAAALKGQKLPEDIAKIGLRSIETSGRKLEALSQQLKTSGNLQADAKPLTREEKAELVAEVLKNGDASRGEAVFRRSSLSCLKCHAIGGAGGRVGPDLLSLGASAQIDYLIDSLLEPSKAVKENYNSLIVATDEGQVITGVKVRQSDTHLILRDMNDKEISIDLKSIAGQRDGKSLMPSGLTEKLTRAELVDLVRFLSELGKVGKFSIGQTQHARRWQVLTDTPAARYRLRRTSYDFITQEDPAFQWEPRYSKVSGRLPLDEIPRVGLNFNIRGKAGIAFARTELEVTQSGTVRLRLNNAEGLQIWRGSAPVEPGKEISFEAKPGRYQLTFAINLDQRDTDLEVSLIDEEKDAAQVRFVTGK